jgi:imidazoleglycerol phosphate dehydratase HisB
MSSLAETKRTGSCRRVTAETEIEARVRLDGTGAADVATGIPFLDHLLAQLARHSGIDLAVTARGDLEIDDHHTVEDTALTLGTALDDALGERRGLRRFGSAYAPLDESLARAVIDLSGRPYAHVDLGLRRERLGTLSTENIPHFLRSLSQTLRATLHVELLRGENDHHRAEAAFKALAVALGDAVALTRGDAVPSTKEAL